MAEREFFVICNNCGSEVSPYVTECPYCGTRLRKSAPDLKKQKKAEAKEERRAEKRRERLKSQYEGGGSSTAWLEPAGGGRPIATISLIAIAVVASVIAASGGNEVTRWMLTHLVYAGSIDSRPWTLFTTPFLQYSLGYGFVCLTTFALFGTGIERRYGPVWVVVLWVVCGAFGAVAEGLLAASAVTYGAYAVAAGSVIAWTIVVVQREDLRDVDTLGLAAFGFVICALPVATDDASVWTLLGGIVGGALCGFALTRVKQR